MELARLEVEKAFIASVDALDWRTMSIEEQVRIVRSLQRGVCRWQEANGIGTEVAGHLIEHAGYCHCCQSRVIFRTDDPWLRDTYLCTSCGSIPRQRNVFRALDELIPAWTQRVIHESSPGDDRIARLSSNYSFSQLDEKFPLGAALPGGGTCQNLERMTFPNDTFDAFVTQDVMEHVFDVPRAINEILRVLKPGGLHIFTTPRFPQLATTVQRASLHDGQVDYLLEPVYHGNPVGDGRALVTFDWGNDLELLFESWTGVPVETRNVVDRERGIDGAYFEVFVMQKPRS